MKIFTEKCLLWVESLNLFKMTIICLFFILFRLIFLFNYNGDFNSVEDFKIAKNLVIGNGYSIIPELGPTAMKVPVYPLFLASFLKIFGSDAKFWIVFTQHILIGLVPLLLFLLSNRAYKLQFRIAGLLFLFHPSYFYYPMVIEVTNIFIPIAIIWFIFYMDLKTALINNKNITKIVIINGIISGIVYLTQPVAMPVIISFYIYLGYKFYKSNYKDMILFIVCFSIVLSPWIIRNYIAFNQFIPAKSHYGNIYEGFLYQHHKNPKYDIVSDKDKNYIDSLKAIKNDVLLDPYFKPIALKLINNEPYLYLEKTIYQAYLYWWIPPRYFSDSSLKFLIVRKLPVLILNLLFLISLILLFKIDKKIAVIFVTILLYFTMIYALTLVANIRFKLDIEWIELIAISHILIAFKRNDI